MPNKNPRGEGRQLAKRICTVIISSVFLTTAGLAQAKHDDDEDLITIIQVSDLHGNMLPHAGVILNPDYSERVVTQGGGITKVATVVKQIRADNPKHLTLGVGDTIHGQAEVLFTMGDAMMPALNALGLDAYTPGNWEFGYGPAVFRHRFAPRPPYPPIPANAQVMVGADGVAGVTKAAFPTLAVNVYNEAPIPAPLIGKRVMDPYKIFEVGGSKVAVIGITASIVPQQSPVFSLGMRFTQGYEEMPGMIEEVKAAGADIIVVQSELGLPQNVQLGREFKEIDVILSAHSHEVTMGAILADAQGFIGTTPGERLSGEARKRLKKGAAIIVEAGEDLYVGRLDLKIEDGKIEDFRWEAVPVDDDVKEDEEIKGYVDAQEEAFIAGKDGEISRHSFLPAGYCPGGPCQNVATRGLQLVDDLDTVVGHTDVLLHRHENLEGIMNNFIADAVRATLDPVVAAQTDWDGVDISMTNGFRFDTPILSAADVPAGKTFRDGRAPGDITLRDLYAYFPISPALTAAEFYGQAIESSLDGVLNAVFNPNPFYQRGGWYVGLTSNVSQKIDLIHRPFSTSGSRIVQTLIDGVRLDPSKKYVFGSCYGHTFSAGRVCRTEGGMNQIFFELTDVDDYNSTIVTAPPVNTTGIVGFGPPKQVAPDRYIHPVHVMRRYLDSLDNHTITEAQFGVGRVQNVDSRTPAMTPEDVPESKIPGIVQPIEGVGPAFLKRIVQVTRHDD